MSASERLAKMQVTLPSVAAPVGSYVPAIKIGSLVMTSGQLPFRDGELTCKGHVRIVQDGAEAQCDVAIFDRLRHTADCSGSPARLKRARYCSQNCRLAS